MCGTTISLRSILSTSTCLPCSYHSPQKSSTLTWYLFSRNFQWLPISLSPCDYTTFETTTQNKNDLCLFLIKQILSQHGRSFQSVGLTLIDPSIIPYFTSHTIDFQGTCPLAEANLHENISRLNNGQDVSFCDFLSWQESGVVSLMYLDGTCSCGKMYSIWLSNISSFTKYVSSLSHLPVWHPSCYLARPMCTPISKF